MVTQRNWSSKSGQLVEITSILISVLQNAGVEIEAIAVLGEIIEKH